MNTFQERLELLREGIEGELSYTDLTRTIYSTDASVYKEVPVAVVWPKNKNDLKKILKFASEEKTGVTLRAGGTSLAGLSFYRVGIVYANSKIRKIFRFFLINLFYLFCV